jgi:O-antigen ligase
VNIELLLLRLILLFLPTQLTAHFWPSWSYVLGIKVDYLAPVIYSTDLLIFALIALWVAKQKTFSLKIKPIAALAAFAALNIIFSNNHILTLTSWLKITPEIMFGCYVFGNSDKVLKTLNKPLILGALLISLLALAQFYLKSSVGGILYWVGERQLDVNTPGIEKTYLLNNHFLRSYSTFPHPNAAAGFISAVLLLYSTKGKAHTIARLILMAAVLTTFSKSAFLVLVIIFALKIQNIKPQENILKVMFYFVTTLSLLLPLANTLLLTNTGFQMPETLSRRLQLAAWSGSIISQNPLLGTGLGGFIVELQKVADSSLMRSDTLDAILQPVHNIFLLLTAETGIVGLVLTILTISLALKKFSNQNTRFGYALLFILLTGSTDHYWLTIKQTRLLMVLIFSLALSQRSARIDHNAQAKEPFHFL